MSTEMLARVQFAGRKRVVVEGRPCLLEQLENVRGTLTPYGVRVGDYTYPYSDIAYIQHASEATRTRRTRGEEDLVRSSKPRAPRTTVQSGESDKDE